MLELVSGRAESTAFYGVLTLSYVPTEIAAMLSLAAVSIGCVHSPKADAVLLLNASPLPVFLAIVYVTNGLAR